jgi:hypothetical protein
MILYSEEQNGSIAAAGPGGVYGRATVSGIPIEYQGVRVRAADYVVKVSFSAYYCDQASLAVTSVNANVTQDGDYLVLQLTLDTATAAGTTGCHWYYDVVCTPKCLAPNATNSVAPFEEKVWGPLRMPGLEVSSITASTISMFASENILINAAVPFEAVIGIGNIGLNASTNVNLMANYDINLDAFQNINLTATSSITLSNVANTAAIGFDETASSFIGGSNVFITAQDTFINSFNNTLIESLSTINNTPNFVVSTNMNSYTIRNVRQPFIQYGDVAGSSNNGNVQVILPVAYSSINSYKAFVTMEDDEPAEMSAVRDSENAFTIYWQQAHSGNHTIAWNTMGDLG